MRSASAPRATIVLVTIFLGLVAFPPRPAMAQAPARIVSINLCADQLLLALADPRQIASLSAFATDPVLSFMAEKAKAFRHDASSAETVVRLEPDLVLAGRFTRLATREMLSRLGYRLVELEVVDTIDEARTQIADVAALVGQPERGASLIAEIDAALADLAAVGTAAATGHSAAIYQRRGYVSGDATLSTDLLARVGLKNVALGGERGGFVALEQLVLTPPDYLVVARASPVAEDQGSALLAHPALQKLFPPERRLILPERLTVCAGPSLAAALRHLAAEVTRVTGAP